MQVEKTTGNLIAVDANRGICRIVLQEENFFTRTINNIYQARFDSQDLAESYRHAIKKGISLYGNGTLDVYFIPSKQNKLTMERNLIATIGVPPSHLNAVVRSLNKINGNKDAYVDCDILEKGRNYLIGFNHDKTFDVFLKESSIKNWDKIGTLDSVRVLYDYSERRNQNVIKSIDILSSDFHGERE